jgi:hypothetical protein
VKSKRVHLGGQLVGEQIVDKAVAGETGLADELGRNDKDAEVRLASPGVGVVPCVQVGFVNNVQAAGVETLFQALPNGCRYRHAFTGICDARLL